MSNSLDDRGQQHDEEERFLDEVKVSPRGRRRFDGHRQSRTYTEQAQRCDDEGYDAPANQGDFVAISFEANCVDWRKTGSGSCSCRTTGYSQRVFSDSSCIFVR